MAQARRKPRGRRIEITKIILADVMRAEKRYDSKNRDSLNFRFVPACSFDEIVKIAAFDVRQELNRIC